jgi:ribonuclease HII
MGNTAGGFRMATPTRQDKIETLKKKLAQTQAKLNNLEMKDRQLLRKADTRFKVVAGATLLAHAAHDASFDAAIRAIFKKNITLERDRVLFQRRGWL